jgi:hypothetical protein
LSGFSTLFHTFLIFNFLCHQLAHLLTDLSKLIDKSKEQLTPQQQMELMQFQSKSNNLFKNVDLQNPDFTKLNQKADEIKELAKKITDGITDNQ